jgi:hypothetical protein
MSLPVPVTSCTVAPGWPMQRILFLVAGTVTLLGVLLTITLSRWFLLVPALVGGNQLLMVATGWCPMSVLLTCLGGGGVPAAAKPYRDRGLPPSG